MLHVSDVTCDPADAAHADAAVSTTQWGATQARSGRGSRRTAAQVPRAKQSGCNKMQAEEESLGDVLRKESRGAHSDQHAASGTNTNHGTHCDSKCGQMSFKEEKPQYLKIVRDVKLFLLFQNEVTMLKNEVTQLKQLLLTHKDCPITTMQKESQGYLSE